MVLLRGAHGCVLCSGRDLTLRLVIGYRPRPVVGEILIKPLKRHLSSKEEEQAIEDVRVIGPSTVVSSVPSVRVPPYIQRLRTWGPSDFGSPQHGGRDKGGCICGADLQWRPLVCAGRRAYCPVADSGDAGA